MTSRLSLHRGVEAAAGIRGALVQEGILREAGDPASDEVLEEILRQEKILLARVALSDKVSAVYMRSEPYALILLNYTKTSGHQRFSLVHEICHHFLHRDLNTWICTVSAHENRGHEREANQFAAAFLLPASSISADFAAHMDQTPDACRAAIMICDRFQTSWQSTVGRLYDLSLIGRSKRNEMLNCSVKSLARKHGVSLDLFRASRKLQLPKEFSSLATELRDRAIISDRKYESLMDDLEALAECGQTSI
jgi:Zn-dependent peptidase ImmA (M78 family)